MKELKEKVANLEAEKVSWDATKSAMEAELAQVSMIYTSLSLLINHAFICRQSDTNPTFKVIRRNIANLS